MGDVITEVRLGFLDEAIGPWAPTARGNFWFLSFNMN